MIDKEIYRHSNAELFDLIKNGTNKRLVKQAKSEFDSRNLKKEEISKIESDYIKYQKFSKERNNKPLTTEEYLTFFFLPFFTTTPIWREEQFSESELERFKNYGFDKKYKQAYKVKICGYIFWLVVLITVITLAN